MAGTPIKATGDLLFPNEFNKNAQGLQNLINATGISVDVNDWEQLQDALNYYILQGAVYEDTSTTANQITLTKSAGNLAGLKMPSSYIEGFYTFYVGTTNTGSTVINVNNIGNKTVKKITRDNTVKTNFTGGEFIAGLKYIVYYDGTDFVYFDIFDNVAKNDEVIKKDGSVAFTGDQSMGNQKLTDLAPPTLDNDATRKKYVDDKLTYTDLEVSRSLKIESTGTNTIQISPFRARSKNGNTVIIENSTKTIITNSQFDNVGNGANYTTSQTALVFYYIFVFTDGTDNKYLIDTDLTGSNAIARLTTLSLTDFITDYRRIGSFYSNGGNQITPYKQNYNQFRFLTPIYDIDRNGNAWIMNGNSAVENEVMTVPGFECNVQYRAWLRHDSAVRVKIRSLNESISVINLSTGLHDIGAAYSSDDGTNNIEFNRFNYDRQLYYIGWSGGLVGVSDFRIATYGWSDNFNDIPTV
jgi:hypothetical protein